MALDLDKQLGANPKLVHSVNQKVESHVQREKGDWFLNTLMLEGCNAPFKYKRKKLYQSLKGARVNLTYYPDVESIAGFDIEVMRVVRLKRA
ncbi:hypothetical protein C2869_13745 [Saccharobesus litoralis]|uniref:Uncharacterized protein n=1 Tax=Saccharobesus litoralis TaxID=2172099 RepID=A0A2S0VTA1_9ALTE|nr:hypothetical protein [Saccharobesus litoralis]AWB67437.1 hypothetical protein C2869_13745 [Saccharobesus litoralis]